MTFSVDLSQLAGLRENLAQYGAEVQGEVSMKGVAAMAKVVYDEARLQAPVSERAHWFYGRNSRRTGVRYLFEPGTLRDAIYRAYSPEKSGDALKLYRVAWNHRKCPYGFMVEYGTAKAPAASFLRKSMSRGPDAVEAGKTAISQALTQIGGTT